MLRRYLKSLLEIHDKLIDKVEKQLLENDMIDNKDQLSTRDKSLLVDLQWYLKSMRIDEAIILLKKEYKS